MERPLRPAFEAVFTSVHLRGKDIKAYIAVPDYVLPMDLYNALSYNGMSVPINHGWITSTGRYVSAEEAAKLALETNLLDRKVEKLSIMEYTGSWKKK